MYYKNYDYKKAKATIKQYLSDQGFGKLVSASLGMEEDWGWTSDTVWLDGKYIIKLNSKTKIGGISRSYFATPILELETEDNFKLRIPCYFETED
jgi:hypothetical protein